MSTQEKGKPGPKRGWVAELRKEVAYYKKELVHMRRRYENLLEDYGKVYHRVNKFNNSTYLERVLWVIFGGKV